MKTQFWILIFALTFISCDFGNKGDKETPDEEVIDSTEAVSLDELGERYEFQGEVPEPEFMYEYGVPFEGIRINDSSFVYQGDIIIDASDSVMQPLEAGQKPPRSAAARTKNFWTNNTVYYTIDPGLNLTSQGYVKTAIATIAANTNIKFINKADAGGYVKFTPATGCYSSIGKTGRMQVIGLSSACSLGSTMHEIIHAIGFWHEQSRADRDKNLKVHWANITTGMEHNFKTYAEQLWDGQDIGNFDFGSIMLYPPGAFSSNGKSTITKLDGSLYSVNRIKPSVADYAAINKVYPKPDVVDPIDPVTPPAPEYENGKYYMISGLTVLRKDNQWWYNGRYGWRQVKLVNGVWYYA